MPTRNVNLTGEIDHFVLSKVESGRYENAKLAALRAAIDEGDDSGIADSDPFKRVRKKLGLKPR